MIVVYQDVGKMMFLNTDRCKDENCDCEGS